MKKFKKIYIAGALTRIGDRQEELYSSYAEIEKLCLGFAEEVFNPNRQGFCPSKDPNVTPEMVWMTEEKHVSESDITIAYVGEPSLGTGGELEIARVNNRKVLLWWFTGEKVSRFARGNPAVVIMIEADDNMDLIIKIKNALNQL